MRLFPFSLFLLFGLLVTNCAEKLGTQKKENPANANQSSQNEDLSKTSHETPQSQNSSDSNETNKNKVKQNPVDDAETAKQTTTNLPADIDQSGYWAFSDSCALAESMTARPGAPDWQIHPQNYTIEKASATADAPDCGNQEFKSCTGVGKKCTKVGAMIVYSKDGSKLICDFSSFVCK